MTTGPGKGDRGLLQRVLSALGELRSPFALEENDLHSAVAQRLAEAGLPYRHEASIGPGCRIDYLVGNVGIEIKNGRPNEAGLKRQLARYAACPAIGALVVLAPRSVRLPDSVLGKPVRMLALNQLWGVALP